MKLFLDNQPFFKGNLHCHTTLSDGLLSPESVIALYQGMGYDFLAITDHRKLSEPTHKKDRMLVLSGIEMDYALPGESLHLVGIGMDPSYDPAKSIRLDPQVGIRQMRKHGGRVILAHPAWSLNTLSTLSSLRNITAAEIYNSISTYPWEGDRADSSIILDIAATHGAPYCFVASDDAHSYNGEAGRSFTMIQADELTQDALFAALDAGRFYASQGPCFEQISIDDSLLTVRCSPVETVIFYSNLSGTRCVTCSGQTEATYDLSCHSDQTFVRCQIIDANGCSAWSNPILLTADPLIFSV